MLAAGEEVFLFVLHRSFDTLSSRVRSEIGHEGREPHVSVSCCCGVESLLPDCVVTYALAEPFGTRHTEKELRLRGWEGARP